VLEYLLTEQNTHIFVLTREALKVITVPEGRDKIRGRITLFQGTTVRDMDTRKLSEQYWMAPMQGLYHILVEPIEQAGYLQNKEQIVIVPQGLLHNLPFQALVSRLDRDESGESHPRYLIEDYVVCYTPSASLLKFCRAKHIDNVNSCLLMAPQVSHLPMSETEVRNIAGIWGSGADYYLNEKATEGILKKRGSDYAVLHFATTANFNHVNPLFSRLMLARCEDEDGNLEVHEIYGLHLNADLVGLSACQTAIGSGQIESLPRGDDLISLSRAFIYAGSPSVVASLWEVADPSTALLMENFYKHRKSMNKAQALAHAQREMLDGEYAHPYYWAPFIMVGDWE
jgi:CHAT domain-containing protein